MSTSLEKAVEDVALAILNRVPALSVSKRNKDSNEDTQSIQFIAEAVTEREEATGTGVFRIGVTVKLEANHKDPQSVWMDSLVGEMEKAIYGDIDTSGLPLEPFSMFTRFNKFENTRQNNDNTRTRSRKAWCLAALKNS